MNKMNEAMLNALKEKIEKVEKTNPDCEIIGFNTAFASLGKDEVDGLFYVMNPKQITEKEAELEDAIEDPKLRRFAAEFNILLQNFRFGFSTIISAAEEEGVIADCEKFTKWMFKEFDAENVEEATEKFFKKMMLNFIMAFAHQ